MRSLKLPKVKVTLKRLDPKTMLKWLKNTETRRSFECETWTEPDVVSWKMANFSCDSCTRNFSTKKSLGSHKKAHSKALKKLEKNCTKDSRKNDAKDKKEAKLFSCGQCQKSFLRKSFLKKHESTTHFYEMTDAEVSKKIHENKNPELIDLTCDETMDETSQNNSQTDGHSETKTLKKVKKSDKDKKETSSKKVSYPCDQCSKSYSRKDTLKLHKSKIHLEKEIIEKKAYIKTDDNDNHQVINLEDTMEITTHLDETIEKPLRIECELCSAVFGDDIPHRKHLDEVHFKVQNRPLGPKGNIQCEFCDFKYRDRKKHFKGYHQIEKELPKKIHPCLMCLAEQGDDERKRAVVFFTYEGIRIHIKRVHEQPDWKYACDRCDLKFIYRYGLELHYAASHFTEYAYSK